MFHVWGGCSTLLAVDLARKAPFTAEQSVSLHYSAMQRSVHRQLVLLSTPYTASNLCRCLLPLTANACSQSRFSNADAASYEKRMYSQFDSADEVPEVLVVGATGETGRVVVRKLLLRGFRVRVLVRNLYSSTLDLLGTGVTYTQGDLSTMSSIVDAVSGVDKVQ
jgi:NmrA-like family